MSKYTHQQPPEEPLEFVIAAIAWIGVAIFAYRFLRLLGVWR